MKNIILYTTISFLAFSHTISKAESLKADDVKVICSAQFALISPELEKVSKSNLETNKLKQTMFLSVTESFYSDCGYSPKTFQSLLSKDKLCKKWSGPYITKIPKDPWGNDYKLINKVAKNGHKFSELVSSTPVNKRKALFFDNLEAHTEINKVLKKYGAESVSGKYNEKQIADRFKNVYVKKLINIVGKADSTYYPKCEKKITSVLKDCKKLESNQFLLKECMRDKFK